MAAQRSESLPTRTPGAALVDLASVAAFAGLWLALGVRLALGGDAATLLLALALAAPLGLVLADLASGVVHWLADTWFDAATPVVGRLVIAPFREHHRAPDAIVRHGFLEVTGNNALACVPGLAALLAWPLAEERVDLWRALLEATALATAAAVGATNHLHRWAHATRAPRAVAWLQRRGLALSPARHAAHHVAADRAYCVATGWLNPLLDRSGLFPALERALRGDRAPGQSRMRPARARRGPQ
jgi:ubiquitin-conjugating enzyme E2 variant